MLMPLLKSTITKCLILTRDFARRECSTFYDSHIVLLLHSFLIILAFYMFGEFFI